MTDIVEHLRADAAYHREVAGGCDCRPEDTANWQHALNADEAADEIERLRAGAAQPTMSARLRASGFTAHSLPPEEDDDAHTPRWVCLDDMNADEIEQRVPLTAEQLGFTRRPSARSLPPEEDTAAAEPKDHQ